MVLSRCAMKALAVEPYSKNRSGAYPACDGFTARSHSTTTQYRQLRRLENIIPKFRYNTHSDWLKKCAL